MSGVTETQILNALKNVIDPDLRQDIVSLGFIKDLHIENGRVSFKIELTTPACPVKEKMRRQALDAVMEVANVQGVDIEMTAKVRHAQKKTPRNLLPGVKNVIAIASGKGGVGKSTTAVNLALALAQTGARTGILDADIYGPSLPKMLKIKDRPHPEEGKHIAPAEAFGLKVMSMGFFMDEETPVVWRGPMVGMAVEQLLRDVEWGELDYLVIDLPPGTGDAQLTLTQKVPITGVVIVSTPQDVALADVKRGINMFRKVDTPILGIIENMSYFLCPHCGHRSEIFSHGGARKQAEDFGLEFLGDIPLDGAIREDADSGIPILIAHPDSPQTQKYREIAARIAAIIATQGFEGSSFPQIVVE
ncbi:MAG: iron-sulfur cluster carrier protein ApbC [Magnetococcales bacterium]|nr:iron-sulfur cluster carrier protein ApbC [Magnetococcales bacterium]MBF0152014.1 iron-sulfur cluster carrier protein ApbC [Magnetococcales bacterium]MBF0348351.1 iron-sulfur cluster carrier protein ApbC [Magnetococcales bacterium]MBF0632946.1 iron-sulfur cluster carrier protein ApbC [Magnetococcales bacterium]